MSPDWSLRLLGVIEGKSSRIYQFYVTNPLLVIAEKRHVCIQNTSSPSPPIFNEWLQKVKIGYSTN